MSIHGMEQQFVALLNYLAVYGVLVFELLYLECSDWLR